MVSGAIASTAHVLLILENASVRLEQRDRDVMKVSSMISLSLEKDLINGCLFIIFVACPQGYFGQNCSQSCGCHGNSSCDPVTGRCHCRCEHNATCDNVTGSCVCAPGWIGETCEKSKHFIQTTSIIPLTVPH